MKNKKNNRESVKNVTSHSQLQNSTKEQRHLIASVALKNIHKYRKRVKFDGGQI